LEWWLALSLILTLLIVFMLSGLPVAFCFMAVNIVGVLLFWGGQVGLRQLILSMHGALYNFSWATLVLFLLMGEVIFHSGVGIKTIDAVDIWLGRLPGRLGLVAIASGALLASLSGSSMATIAVMGSTLTPEMERRGYKKPMSLGPILGSSGIAKMIPPSSVAVILAVLANISVAKLLAAIIVPGLIMSFFYAIYTILRCWLQPSIAPSYEVKAVPLSKKIMMVVTRLLPLGLIIFLVTGVILLGVATPSEAAATGALGCFILVACYRKLTWEVTKKSLVGTLRTSCMVLFILTGAKAFTQILSFSGAIQGLTDFAISLPLTTLWHVIIMQLVALFLGCFMSVGAVFMISVPIFMPIVYELGLDPLWFAVLLMINGEMGPTTPPFGLSMFVLKGVAPPDTTMGDIYKAAVPYLACDALTMILILAIPSIPLWLPGVMG